MTARYKPSTMSKVVEAGAKVFEAKDVADACGVLGGKPGKLMGESTEDKVRAKAAKDAKKKRSSQAVVMYTVFCAAYGAAMWAAFNDMIPVMAWERMDLPTVLWYSDFLAANIYVPFALAGLYVLVVFGIQHMMQDRKPFDLRYALAGWSLFLSAFSVFGSLRTVPALFKMVSNRGVYHLVCEDTRYEWLVGEPAGVWTILFILSKVPELVDTLFIVLRKTKLITLHWYHHITVMIFCWHSLATLCMNGIIFSSMNLTVHAFMYFFYALTALGYRPTSYAMSITMIQIAQMLVGTAVTVFVNIQQQTAAMQSTRPAWLNVTWDKFNTAENMNRDACETVHPTSALAGLSMYASYLWLFCAFFYYAYLSKPAGASKQKAE